MSLTSPVRIAVASPADEARALNDKATAAFALNRFPEAAAQFEKAFELKPDSALLYNAAQSHRLAGNKERALMLYQSYLRVYGKEARRPEVEARIRELKEAIAKSKPAATPPPAMPLPAAVPPQPLAAPTASLMAQPAAADGRADAGRAWVWFAIGGAVVAAVAVTLLLVVKKDPDPSIGVLP